MGPRHELEAVGVPCAADAPHVGKHLKDHLMVPLFFPAPGIGVTMQEIALSMGSAALRGSDGPLPADPGEDAHLSAELQALKQEAERRLNEWETTGHGLLASSLADAVAFWSTGLRDTHSHDAQIILFATAGNDDLLRLCLNVDTARYFDDAATRLSPDAAGLYLLPNLALPHSEGEIVLQRADPDVHPSIRMNDYGDPYDMQVMIAVIKRTLEIAAHWPGHHKIGPLLIPPFPRSQAWIRSWRGDQ